MFFENEIHFLFQLSIAQGINALIDVTQTAGGSASNLILAATIARRNDSAICGGHPAW
jgi:hypothetical protein